MALQLSSHRTSPLANAGGLGSQLGIGDHFFDIAEAVRPVAESFAGERAAITWDVIVKRTGGAAKIAAGQTLAALSLAPLARLPWLLAVLRLAGLAFPLLLAGLTFCVLSFAVLSFTRLSLAGLWLAGLLIFCFRLTTLTFALLLGLLSFALLS